MKTETFDVRASVLTPARLIKITRPDGTIYRIAEAQNAIVVGEGTYLPIGRTMLHNIRQTLGGGVPSTKLVAAMHADGPFVPADVDNGKFKNAKVQIWYTDRLAPLASPYFTGYIGRTTYSWPQAVEFEIRGLLARGKGSMMEHFGPMCRTDLGSIARCKAPIRPPDVARGTAYVAGQFVRARPSGSTTPDGYADRVYECTTAGTTHATVQPSYDTTIGNTTTDGTAVFTARNAFLRWGRIAGVTDSGHGLILNRNPDARATTSVWFAEGHIYFVSGYSNTEAEPIAAWSLGDLKITVYRDMTGLVAVDDWVELHRGCDKTSETCTDVFANKVNFRGEPAIQGADVATGAAPVAQPARSPVVVQL